MRSCAILNLPLDVLQELTYKLNIKFQYDMVDITTISAGGIHGWGTTFGTKDLRTSEGGDPTFNVKPAE